MLARLNTSLLEVLFLYSTLEIYMNQEIAPSSSKSTAIATLKNNQTFRAGLVAFLSFIVFCTVFYTYKLVKISFGVKNQDTVLAQTSALTSAALSQPGTETSGYLLGSQVEQDALSNLLKRVDVHRKKTESDTHLQKSAQVNDSWANSMQGLFVQSNIDQVVSASSSPDLEKLLTFLVTGALTLSANGNQDKLSVYSVAGNGGKKQPFLIKTGDGRFVVLYQFLDSLQMVDVVNEDGVSKFDIISPFFNCKSRKAFFDFYSNTELMDSNIHQDSKPLMICNDGNDSDPYFKAFMSTASHTVDVPLVSSVAFGGREEFNKMYNLSRDISKDITDYFYNTYPGQKLDATFVRANFPDELLKKYYGDDYSYIENYEFVAKSPVDATKLLRYKRYRDFAVSLLFEIGFAYNDMTVSSDAIKDKEGNNIAGDPLYHRLLTLGDGSVVYPTGIPRELVLTGGVSSSFAWYPVRIRLDASQNFKQIDLFYFTKVEHCAREGQKVLLLLEARCGYPEKTFMLGTSSPDFFK